MTDIQSLVTFQLTFNQTERLQKFIIYFSFISFKKETKQ